MVSVRTVTKAILAVLSMAMVGAMVVLTVVFNSGHQARADNVFGGAGDTITQTTAPSVPDTPSAAPAVLATPFGA
jgi:hypothetical protein